MVGAHDKTIEKYYSKENKSEYFEYENDNSGFIGYTICSYGKLKGLLEILQENKCLKLNPDIIILQIGTNNVIYNLDFIITINNFISLIIYLLDNINKNTIIFVATIHDINTNVKNIYKVFKNYRKDNCSDDEVKNKVNDYVMKFNKEITEIVEKYRNNNYKIRIKDLNPVIKDIDNLFYDGIHPNDKGYKIMGEFWSEIIDKYLIGHF